MLKQYLLLKPYLKQHWYRYLLGIIFLFITNAGQMAIPQTIRRSINHISQGNIDTSKILHWMLYMLGFALVVTLGRIAWRHYIQGASRRIERDLRGKVFQHLLQLGREFYGTMKTGDIMARLTNDMHHIRMATGMALVAFMDGLFMTLFILIILFRSYPKLTWLLILPLPLLTLLILLVGPYLGKLFRAVLKG
jgi:ATP-binding cassette subfamily B multidrug efflux pump